MEKSRLERSAPLTGVAFVILAVAGVALALPGSPDFMAPADDYVHYFSEHDGEIIIGSLLLGGALFFLMWFIGSLRSALREAEGGDGRVASVAAMGGAVGVAMMLAANSARAAAAFRMDEQGTLESGTAAALGDMADVLWGLAAPVAFGVLVAGTAVLGFRHGAVPQWMSWASTVLAVALVFPFGSWLAIMVFPLWVLIMSAILYRRENAAAGARARAGAVAAPA